MKLLLAVGSEVRVQFDHSAARGLGLRAVDLDLVVALRVGESGCDGEENEERKKALQAVS